MAASHIALLRGLNLASRNRVPMAELREIFEANDCSAVRHYLQSGNIVCNCSRSSARTLPQRISAGLFERYGFTIPVQLRTVPELEAIVAANPYGLGDGAEILVMFLKDRPEADAIARLDPARSAPDTYQVINSEIYMRLMNSAADTRLTTAYFDRQLSTIGTARNWRTVESLVQLAHAPV